MDRPERAGGRGLRRASAASADNRRNRGSALGTRGGTRCAAGGTSCAAVGRRADQRFDGPPAPPPEAEIGSKKWLCSRLSECVVLALSRSSTSPAQHASPSFARRGALTALTPRAAACLPAPPAPAPFFVPPEPESPAVPAGADTSEALPPAPDAPAPTGACSAVPRRVRCRGVLMNVVGAGLPPANAAAAGGLAAGSPVDQSAAQTVDAATPGKKKSRKKEKGKTKKSKGQSKKKQDPDSPRDDSKCAEGKPGKKKSKKGGGKSGKSKAKAPAIEATEAPGDPHSISRTPTDCRTFPWNTRSATVHLTVHPL